MRDVRVLHINSMANGIGINDSWAGRPFEDLKLLMEHLAQMPFLDQSKAVLMGASYGGYLISWAMGEAFIKEVRPSTSKKAI